MRRRPALHALAAAAVLTLGLAACANDTEPTVSASPLTTSGSASAAPAPVVEELSEGNQPRDLAVKVNGPVQVNHRKITIPPGAGTGRHCHDGQLIGVVSAGTLTHYAPIYPDGVHEYEAGDSLVEGSGYVHEGKNEGTEDVVLWVTYLTPKGDPLAETDLANCDSE